MITYKIFCAVDSAKPITSVCFKQVAYQFKNTFNTKTLLSMKSPIVARALIVLMVVQRVHCPEKLKNYICRWPNLRIHIHILPSQSFTCITKILIVKTEEYIHMKRMNCIYGLLCIINLKIQLKQKNQIINSKSVTFKVRSTHDDARSTSSNHMTKNNKKMGITAYINKWFPFFGYLVVRIVYISIILYAQWSSSGGARVERSPSSRMI